jgi:hypothetical protein
VIALNPACLQSICEDCARLAIDHGYEDIADPEHPLAHELATLTPADRARIGVFVWGATEGNNPAPIETQAQAITGTWPLPAHEPMSPLFRVYLCGLLVLALTVAFFALYHELNPRP